MSGKHILLIGRWCPFHNGHRFIVDAFLNNGVPVCIAIRETDEMYSVSDRMLMIQSVYKDKIQEGKVKIITIPDIYGVAVGRNVGYFVLRTPEPIHMISGTDIRAGKSNEVPPEVQEVLDYIHSRRDKRDNSE